jgi:hypothetical protein
MWGRQGYGDAFLTLWRAQFGHVFALRRKLASYPLASGY